MRREPHCAASIFAETDDRQSGRALGSPTSGKDVHDGYTWALIDALSAHVVPKLPAGTQFRFIYTSGSAVETDASKSLLFLGGVRKMRVSCSFPRAASSSETLLTK